jgi:hypothetical protein
MHVLQRLVEAPDFLAFLAMLIVLVATNWVREAPCQQDYTFSRG